MSRRFLVAVAAAALAAGLPAAAQAQKDSVIISMVLEPPVLDPLSTPASAVREITYSNIYESLYRIDRDNKLQPQLAESHTVSADGKVYTFKLRQGVTFHNGKPFDSSIVKFNLEAASKPDAKNPSKQLFQMIEKVETPDANTAVVHLKWATARLIYNLAWPDIAMFDPATIDGNKTNPIGTGPYKFVRWNKGDRVELERYADYWQKPGPKIQKATFRFIGDPQAQVNAMIAGDVDYLPNLVAPEAADQFKKDPRFVVTSGLTEGETIVAINNAKPPFNDVRVRRALAHAIDRKQVIDGAMHGFGVPIGSHFSPLHPAYVDLTGMYPYDPKKAKQLLAEAGYPNGFATTLRLPPVAHYARRGGEIVAAMLEEVGIKAKQEPLEWAQWLDQVLTRKDYDLTIISHTEPMDYDRYARTNYYWGYVNPAFGQLNERIEREIDPAKLTAMLQEAQKIIANDAVNVFMFQLPKIGIAKAGLVGTWLNSPIPANELLEWQWK